MSRHHKFSISAMVSIADSSEKVRVALDGECGVIVDVAGRHWAVDKHRLIDPGCVSLLPVNARRFGEALIAAANVSEEANPGQHSLWSGVSPATVTAGRSRRRTAMPKQVLSRISCSFSKLQLFRSPSGAVILDAQGTHLGTDGISRTDHGWVLLTYAAVCELRDRLIEMTAPDAEDVRQPGSASGVTPTSLARGHRRSAT